jgi:hypothetical protein
MGLYKDIVGEQYIVNLSMHQKKWKIKLKQEKEKKQS